MLYTGFCSVIGIEADAFTYCNPQKVSNMLKPELQETAREVTAGCKVPVPRRQGLMVRFLLYLPYPFSKRLGRPQSAVRNFPKTEKNTSHMPGLKPQTVQPVA